mmetsp:Transcript_99829/g.320354  ORF Transcript_99829/g.320354 Transcript_99829/m.320354 type:complete len:126 (+) Transcript_99829:113-490(+)
MRAGGRGGGAPSCVPRCVTTRSQAATSARTCAETVCSRPVAPRGRLSGHAQPRQVGEDAETRQREAMHGHHQQWSGAVHVGKDAASSLLKVFGAQVVHGRDGVVTVTTMSFKEEKSDGSMQQLAV